MKLFLRTLLLTCSLAAPVLAAENKLKNFEEYLIDEVLRQAALNSHCRNVDEGMEVETRDIPDNPFYTADVVDEDAIEAIIKEEKPETVNVSEKEAELIKRDIDIFAQHGIIAELDLFPKNIPNCFASIPQIFTVNWETYNLLNTNIIDKEIQQKEVRKGLKEDINVSKRTLLFDFCQEHQKIGQMELSLSDYFKDSIEINFTFHPSLRKKVGLKFHNEMTSVLSLLLSNVKRLAQQNNFFAAQKINHIIMNTFYTLRNEELELTQTAIDTLSDPNNEQRMLRGPLDHPFYNDLYVYYASVN